MNRAAKELTAQKRASLARKLAAYSMAAGSSLAMADEVQAGLVFFTPERGPVVLREGSSFSIDLNADDRIDYSIDAVSHNYLGAVGVLFQITGGGTPTFLNLFSPSYAGNYAGNYAGLIQPGSQVGPDTAGWHNYGALFETASPAGEFLHTRGWLGLYFEIPGGSPHFGYLDLEGAGDTLLFHGGAFESEVNTPISAIPEPGSLVLLAMGAAGLAAWRAVRRRKAEA